MADKELFRTAIRGYDKDEVLQEIQNLKDTFFAEKAALRRQIEALKKELDAKDKDIQDMRERLASTEEELNRKNKEIKEKYQSYIDNYETIGGLIYESKIRSQQLIQEAEKEHDKIIENAKLEAQTIRGKAREDAKAALAATQKKIDKQEQEGTQKYNAMQEELNGLVGLINNVQRQFMQSYKSIQSIVDSTPRRLTMDDMEEDGILESEDFSQENDKKS